MKNEQKDWLARAMEAHESIGEHLHFLKTIPREIRTEAGWVSLKNMEQFLDVTLPRHFKLEDEEIFPALLEQEPDSRLSVIIKELKHQHVFMLKRAGVILGIIRGNMHPLPAAVIKQLNATIYEFGEVLLTHAHEEDEQVFPHLKKRA